MRVFMAFRWVFATLWERISHNSRFAEFNSRFVLVSQHRKLLNPVNGLSVVAVSLICASYGLATLTAPGGGATARRNSRGISLPCPTTFGKSTEPAPLTVRVGAAGAGTMDTGLW